MAGGSVKRTDIIINEYASAVVQNKTLFDPEWLEETSARDYENIESGDFNLLTSIYDADPTAVRDQDGDRYLEIRRETLERLVDEGKVQGGKFHLAPYFYDDKGPARIKIKRLELVPLPLKHATLVHDFKSARAYFAKQAAVSTDPKGRLNHIYDDLARHLAATGMHSGLYTPIYDIEDPVGFSVHSDGRLRISCIGFASLAVSDLRDIPDLDIKYITFGSGARSGGDIGKRISPPFFIKPESSQEIAEASEYSVPDGLNDLDPTLGHTILLVSDRRNNTSLIVDNNRVTFVDGENIQEQIPYFHDISFSNYEVFDMNTGESRIYDIRSHTGLK